MILIACAAPVSAQASSYTQEVSLVLSPSQISSNVPIHSPGPIKTVWDSSNLPLTPVTLFYGDTLTLDIKFDNSLRATDLQNPVDTNEMIYWCLGGAGSLSATQAMAYVWQFTSTSGSLLSSSVSGNGLLRRLDDGSIQGVINVGQTFEEQNLTDSSFSFGGIRLTLTIPQVASGWTPAFVRLAFASDGLAIVPRAARLLNVSRGDPARLSWSTNLAGFGLQTKTNLNSQIAWEDLHLNPVIIGTNYVVTNTFNDSSRYFRLSNWPQRNCVYQMRQIGSALKIWDLDWQDRFPFHVPTAEGGTMELRAIGPDGFDTNSYVHLQVMSNYLGTTTILACPGDFLRQAATDFANLRPENVTYRLRTGDTVTESNPGEVVAVCPIDGNTLYCSGLVTNEAGF